MSRVIASILGKKTEREIWDASIQDAEEGLLAARAAGREPSGGTVVCASAALDLKMAYDAALENARRLAESAMAIVRELELQGVGAPADRHGVQTQARDLGEALNTLHLRRQMFTMASGFVGGSRCTKSGEAR